MATATHDYDKLEREFIGSDISIRGLCKKHGIKGYSSVAQYAREHGWIHKRAVVQGKVAEKTAEKVAERLSDEEADEITRFRNESLMVVRAALYKFAEDLRDPNFRVRADELVKLIQLGLLLNGQPTERIEERRLDVVATFDNLPVDVLRRIVDSTRPRPAIGEPEVESARAGAQSTRPN